MEKHRPFYNWIFKPEPAGNREATLNKNLTACEPLLVLRAPKILTGSVILCQARKLSKNSWAFLVSSDAAEQPLCDKPVQLQGWKLLKHCYVNGGNLFDVVLYRRLRCIHVVLSFNFFNPSKIGNQEQSATTAAASGLKARNFS